MQELSSFGRGKKIRPKMSLTRLLQATLQLSVVFFTATNHKCFQKFMHQQQTDHEKQNHGVDQNPPVTMHERGVLNPLNSTSSSSFSETPTRGD